MKPFQTLLMLLCLMTVELAGQDSIFAYVHDGSKARVIRKRLVKGYKLEVAQAVFDDLIHARGESGPKPVFVMNTGRDYVAWMNPIKKQVGLEEHAYDFCASLGKDSLNALANLLAHEVIHYYADHSWKLHFVNIDHSVSSMNEEAEMELGKEQEMQADLEGGMLAIAAGYNTYQIGERLIQGIYQQYNLDEELDGYPSLDERKRMQITVKKKLQELDALYQMANLLVLSGKHEIAHEYYRKILEAFKGYEILNNAAVNAGLAALDLIEKEKVPFILPFEMDRQSRLSPLNNKATGDTADRIERLLEEAMDYLEEALKLNEAQTMAHLNMALILTLQEKYFKADLKAQEAAYHNKKQVGNKTLTTANIQIAQGIMSALQGEKTEARELFQKALKGNQGLAKANLTLLDDPQLAHAVTEQPAFGLETIDDLVFEDFLVKADEVDVSARLHDHHYCGQQNYKSSTLFLDYLERGRRQYYFVIQQTQPGYSGATLKGIQLNASETKIRSAYGLPAKEIQLESGKCLMYTNNGILFILNSKNILTSWAVFQSNHPQ